MYEARRNLEAAQCVASGRAYRCRPKASSEGHNRVLPHSRSHAQSTQPPSGLLSSHHNTDIRKFDIILIAQDWLPLSPLLVSSKYTYIPLSTNTGCRVHGLPGWPFAQRIQLRSYV